MKHVNQLLPDFIKGTVSEDDHANVKEHLVNCAVCLSEYKELQQTVVLLQQGYIPEPDRSYFTNLLPRLRQRQKEKSLFWRLIQGKTMRLALPLSAMAMMGLTLFLLPFRMNIADDSMGLRNLIGNMPNDELSDVAVEQDKTSLVAESHEFASAIVSEHLYKDHVIKEALLSDAGTEILSNTELEKVVEEFDTNQVDHLLAQLVERKSL
jgi:hypothetical protein